MATRPEHSPEYNKTKARIGRVWQKVSHARLLPVDHTKGFFKAYAKGVDDATLDDMTAAAFGSIFVTMGLMFSGAVALPVWEKEITTAPEFNESVQFDHDLDEAGYIALSNDDGQTGYAIFRDDNGVFNLYNFARSTEFSGSYELTHEGDPDDAWFTSRGMYHDYSTLLRALEDINAPFDHEQWDVYSFDGVSDLIQKEGEPLTRIAGALIPQEDVYGSISGQFNVLQDVWLRSTNSIVEGQTGYTDQYVEMNQTSYEADTVHIADGNWNEYTFGGMIGLGSLLLLSHSIPAVNRRRTEQRQDKAQSRSPKL